MSVKDLLTAGKAVYKTINDSVTKATGDENALSNNINKLATGIKNGLSAKRAENEDKYPRFDPSNAKSTVVNPSEVFPGISKEDEKLIYKILDTQYANASKLERNQAVQGLYTSLLESQREKDIDAGRQEVIFEYQRKKEDATSSRERNTYNSEIQKSRLADLIKDKLSQQGVNIKKLNNITDDGIIAGFIESNPQYEDAFNKFFYTENDAISLGKDLGWIEKTTKDKVVDKIKGFGEGMAGWIPKFGEGVDDFLGLGDQKESAWINFVNEKYGTAPASLTEADYNKAKQEFENSNISQYMPTAASAATKMAEGAVDIAFTASGLNGLSTIGKGTVGNIAKNIAKNEAVVKAGFSAAAETPILEKGPEFLGDTLSFIGENVNKIPGFSKIRDSLQTEQEKADWDAFVGGNVLALLRGGKNTAKDLSNVDIDGIKKAFDSAKEGNFTESVNAIKENINENKNAKINEQKQKQVQQITQGDINTREKETAGFDLLNKEGKLDNVKSIDDLNKVIDETIDTKKQEQTDLATKSGKKYGVNDITTEEMIPGVDEQGNKTSQLTVNRDFAKLLDKIIEYYDDVDSAKAKTYKSYKRALDNGVLPEDIALDIKREGNILGQKVFNKKTGIQKNSEKADGWTKMMENVNKAFEKLDIGEELRKRDSELSSLYQIKNDLAEVSKKAADLEKKTKELGLGEKLSKKAGETVKHFLSTLTLGQSDILMKMGLSFLRAFAGGQWGESPTYNAIEVRNNIPKFIKEYQILNDKLNGKNITKNKATKLVNEFIDKREAAAVFNEND